MRWWKIGQEYQFDYVSEQAPVDLLAEAQRIGEEITVDEIVSCETAEDLALFLDFSDCACSGIPSGVYAFTRIDGVLMDEFL